MQSLFMVIDGLGGPFWHGMTSCWRHDNNNIMEGVDVVVCDGAKVRRSS